MKGPDKRRLDEFINHPKKAVWILAYPMIASFVVHAIYHITDTYFIGILGSSALAAATYVGALFFIAISLMVGLGTGVTASVARAFGAKDNDLLSIVSTNAIFIGLILGVLFCAAGLSTGKSIMPLLGADDTTSFLAWQYFRVISLGMPLFFITSVFRSVLTGKGNTKTPMVIMALSTVINLVLDPFFMFTLEMGIKGAAWATVAAQLFSIITYFFIFRWKEKTLLIFRWKYCLPSLKVFLGIITIGIPVTAAQLVMSAGSVLTNRVLSEFGQSVVAGYGAANRVDMLVAMPILGLAGASISVISIFAGAGKPNLIRMITKYVIVRAVLISLVIGTIAWLFSRTIIDIFTDDAVAIQSGSRYLFYMFFAYPFMAFGMTGGRILQGLGHGLASLVFTIVRVFIIGLSGAYIAVYFFHAPIDFVWLSFLLGGFISTLLTMYWLKRSVWNEDPQKKFNFDSDTV